MKIVKRLLVGLVVLVVVLFLGIVVLGGRMIKTGVNRIGPQVTGVAVTLDDVDFRPLRGYVRLNGLVVGNPEGFNTESLFDMQELEVELDVRSLFTDTINIRRIVVESPQITYEVGLRRTNLGVLIDGLESSDSSADEEDDASKAGKKVVIKELKIVKARARISTPGMGSKAVPIQLATITLTDLGGEDQSAVQITGQVLKAILGAVGNAALDMGGLAGDSVKVIAQGVGKVGGAAVEGAGVVVGTAVEGASVAVGAAGEGAKAVGKGVKAAGSAAGEGVKAVGGAATEGAKAAAGVAGDGVKAVGNAAGEGVRAVGSGVGRILGLKKDDDKQPDAE